MGSRRYIIISNIESNIGSLPIDIYYNEEDVLGLYNWIGNQKPGLQLLKKLKRIPFSEYDDIAFGKTIKMEATVLLSRNELKRLNIEVIGREMDDIEKSHDHPVGYNIYNFDDRIIRALEREKKKGNLVEDFY